MTSVEIMRKCLHFLCCDSSLLLDPSHYDEHELIDNLSALFIILKKGRVTMKRKKEVCGEVSGSHASLRTSLSFLRLLV